MDSETIRYIDDIIVNACTNNQYDWRILTEWAKVKVSYEEFPALKEELALLKTPPFRYAIYLEPGNSDPNTVTIGLNGVRLDVCLGDTAITRDDLVPGQVVLLNSMDNVVAIQNDKYFYGTTAEVVNILREDDEVQVIEVVEAQGSPDAVEDGAEPSLHLRVRWQEDQILTVSCSKELIRQHVRKGWTVQLNPEQTQAMRKARPSFHVKHGANDGMIVEVSNQLAEQEVRIGDIVSIDPNLKFAFEKLPIYETKRFTLEEETDVTYNDIGGLSKQIEQIYDAIELPYLYRERFERFQLMRPKGILLYGPPGCGKTMIAKAVANSLEHNIRTHLLSVRQHILLYKKIQQEPGDADAMEQYRAMFPNSPAATEVAALQTLEQYLQTQDVKIEQLNAKLHEMSTNLGKDGRGVRSYFFNIKGPELLDKYVGETEYRIRRIFEEARDLAKYHTPVIIFFDEMEAMFRTRGSGQSSDVEVTIVPQLLAEIDGVESTRHIVIIGASNRQEMIDPAILRPGRLDVKIKVDRPSQEAAQAIFAMHLMPTLPFSVLDFPVTYTIGMSGQVVFGAAYRATGAAKNFVPLIIEPQSLEETPQVIQQVISLLPGGCDIRLALSLTHTELTELEEYATTTIRGSIARWEKKRLPVKKLHSFRADSEVGEIGKQLRQLQACYESNLPARRVIEQLVRQEWIAEKMLLEIVERLYSPKVGFKVVTDKDNVYTFAFKDFMSGAVIANIVARAKRYAIKDSLIDYAATEKGISLENLWEGARQEFEENKDQFVQQKMYGELNKGGEGVQSVKLVMDIEEIDPWSEEKNLLYKKVLNVRSS